MKSFILIVLCVCNVTCRKHSELESYPLKATMRTSSGQLISAIFSHEETKFSKGQSTQGDEITIAGLKKGGEYSLTLVIIKPQVGTFDLSSGPGWIGTNCNASIPYPNNSYTSWGTGSGLITIESFTDSTVKGKFNAICIGINDTLKITDGSFSGKFK